LVLDWARELDAVPQERSALLSLVIPGRCEASNFGAQLRI
jgi:hypothetical protein